MSSRKLLKLKAMILETDKFNLMMPKKKLLD